MQLIRKNQYIKICEIYKNKIIHTNMSTKYKKNMENQCSSKFNFRSIQINHEEKVSSSLFLFKNSANFTKTQSNPI